MTLRRLAPLLTFIVGTALAGMAGFFSPCWYLGFAPLSAGALFASFYLVDDGEGATSGDTPRPRRS